LAVGEVDVDGMLARIPSRLLTEWLAYAQLEPFGEERADLRAGIVAAAVVNVQRGRGAPAAKPSEFMPQFDADELADDEYLLRKVELLNAAFGGQDLRH
jgi:hypothetical protein